nr:RNA-directed DNA polymerase, eukaryota [Tanacetum cinerariifolium]
YIDTKPNHELIYYCLKNPPYKYTWAEKVVPVSEGSPETTIKRLKQGESINVQDLETNLYWEFSKFTSRDGESLESYYLRFYKMMNELVRNQSGGKDGLPMLAPDKVVLVSEGCRETTTERYMENYKNVSQDRREQLNTEAEAVQIILTGIDNDIYSTVDACPNAC